MRPALGRRMRLGLSRLPARVWLAQVPAGARPRAPSAPARQRGRARVPVSALAQQLGPARGPAQASARWPRLARVPVRAWAQELTLVPVWALALQLGPARGPAQASARWPGPTGASAPPPPG